MKNNIIILLLIGFLACEDSNEKIDHKDYGIVINEINYNSSELFDPDDWVEIYNNSMDAVDISLWLLKDKDDEHIFTIPLNTVLLPNQFLVFCKDTSNFTHCFPDVIKYVGNIGFGLSGGSDMVRLYDSNGAVVDVVEYDDDDPWPISADGNGPTIELKNPSLDNEMSENWAASKDYGTPGELNSVFTNN